MLRNSCGLRSGDALVRDAGDTVRARVGEIALWVDLFLGLADGLVAGDEATVDELALLNRGAWVATVAVGTADLANAWAYVRSHRDEINRHIEENEAE